MKINNVSCIQISRGKKRITYKLKVSCFIFKSRLRKVKVRYSACLVR